MSKWSVEIEARVTFETEVEAETESEAREKAMVEWDFCDINDLEFWDDRVTDISEVN